MFSTKPIILYSVSALWILSELILDAAKFSRDKSHKRDRGSFAIINATIWTAIALGVFISINGLNAGVGEIKLLDPYLFNFGLLLIILGVFIRRIAILTLQRQFTVNVVIVKNHQIIDSGIYKHIRHPAYLGSLFSFLGLGISYQNWISLIVVFLPILISFLYRLRIEEQALIEHFNGDYLLYQKATKRLIPKIC
jgi:protein-S-isoprenylcysteine O-methyltransferase Ste14